ncbi:MAG: hypothetical protein GY749_48205 [Desulfobacteraceae bacterium]|nr:hypothetical protein [Desulfobacteraceae bacterium]
MNIIANWIEEMIEEGRTIEIEPRQIPVADDYVDGMTITITNSDGSQYEMIHGATVEDCLEQISYT